MLSLFGDPSFNPCSSVVFHQEWFFSPGSIWQYVETFWLSIGRCYWHPGTLLNILRYTGQFPTTKNYPTQFISPMALILRNLPQNLPTYRWRASSIYPSSPIALWVKSASGKFSKHKAAHESGSSRLPSLWRNPWGRKAEGPHDMHRQNRPCRCGQRDFPSWVMILGPWKVWYNWKVKS